MVPAPGDPLEIHWRSTSSGVGHAGDVDLDADAVLAGSRVPGCTVAVRDRGEVVLDRGVGTARAGSDRAMSATTRLQACSMSKPVAVLAALRLVERGVLDLDADVSDRLSRWTLPANGDWRPRITLRQLASHTAGLTAHGGFPGYRRGAVLPTLPEVLDGRHPANAPGARVDLLPGTRFRYSGAGTTVLQLLLEEATGASTADLLGELVLEPLGMRDSTFVQDLDDPDRADGHRSGARPVPGGWHLQPEQAAAGLWTTAADYLRLLDGVQRAHAGEPGALLAPDTAREVLRPVAPLPGPDLTGMTHIGLGFFVAAVDGLPTWFGHTGSNTGFVCASVASVADRRAAVVLTNSDDGTPVVGALLRAIATDRGWADLALAAPTPGRPAGLGPHAGRYRTDELAVELVEEDGAIELRLPHQPPVALHLAGPASLATDDLDLRVLLEDDGSVALVQGGHTTRLAPQDG